MTVNQYCAEPECTSDGKKDKMRESLADWFDQVEIKPSDRIKQTGEFYNGFLTRVAIMCLISRTGCKRRTIIFLSSSFVVSGTGFIYAAQ